VYFRDGFDTRDGFETYWQIHREVPTDRKHTQKPRFLVALIVDISCLTYFKDKTKYKMIYKSGHGRKIYLILI
jgi:hypothetical protein